MGFKVRRSSKSDLLHNADHTFHPVILASSSTNQGCESVVYLLHGKGVRVMALAIENLYAATQQGDHCGERSLPAQPTVLVISDNKIWLLSI